MSIKIQANIIIKVFNTIYSVYRRTQQDITTVPTAQCDRSENLHHLYTDDCLTICIYYVKLSSIKRQPDGTKIKRQLKWDANQNFDFQASSNSCIWHSRTKTKRKLTRQSKTIKQNEDQVAQTKSNPHLSLQWNASRHTVINHHSNVLMRAKHNAQTPCVPAPPPAVSMDHSPYNWKCTK